MDSRQAGEILAYLSAAWPRYELHEETIRVWVDQLRSVDFGAAQQAARRIVAEDDWFPAVSRLKSLCRPSSSVGLAFSGCDACDRGFRENGDGEVVVCRNCRQNVYPQSEYRNNQLPAVAFDWREGMSETRKKLGESNARQEHSGAS